MKIRNKTEEKMCNDFFNIFNKYIDCENFSKIKTGSLNGKSVDGYIEDTQKRLYAIIEFKLFLGNNFSRQLGKSQLRQLLCEVNARFAILTDSRKFYLCDSISKKSVFKKISFDKLLLILFPKKRGSLVSKNYEIIKKLFSRVKLNKLKLNQNCLLFRNGSFSFTKNFETAFVRQFSTLSVYGKLICRYVSLETAFQIVKNKKIRMNGIVGMNDSTEVDFLGKILYEKNLKEIELQNMANNVYIMSCSSESSIDDLTQWRLYGDDACGACLVFELKKNMNEKFKIGRVEYLDKENIPEFIAGLKEFVDAVYDETLFPFSFHNFHEWSHFYKPKEYEKEDEVRLLYVNNTSLKRNWFVAAPINVISSYVEIPLSKRDFPLKLKKIYLGPKCPEKKVNQNQLYAMLEESGVKNVEVELSEIESYR